jgi:hypothetical protein
MTQNNQKNASYLYLTNVSSTALQIFFTRGIYSNTRKAGTNKTHYIQAMLVLKLANEGKEQQIQNSPVIPTLLCCTWQGCTTMSVQVK